MEEMESYIELLNAETGKKCSVKVTSAQYERIMNNGNVYKFSN